MRTRLAVTVGLALLLCWTFAGAAAQAPRLVLALGNASFVDRSIVQALGAELSQDSSVPLKNISVLILADIPYSELPGAMREGLVSYIEAGGALLITGGSRSFGSGGYKAVSAIIPFEIRSDNDWRFISFRHPVPVQPGHPILAGIIFGSVGTVNDMNPRPGAMEILQSPGGGRAPGVGVGGGSYLYPLAAEVTVAAGRVIGIAFDVNDSGTVRNRDLFVRNVLSYLLAGSRIGLGR